jgi:glutathione S-transferase
LLPTDLEGEVRVLEMTEYLVSTVHMQGYTRLRRPEKFTPNQADHPTVQAQGLAIFQAGLDRAEQQLQGQDWLFGRLSIADFALFYLGRWGVVNGLGALGQNVRAHHDRLWSRPAIQRALASEFNTAL